jgi:hypothetical protein
MKIKYLSFVLIFIYCLFSCKNDKNSIPEDKTQGSDLRNDKYLRNESTKSNDLGKKWLFNFYKDYINFYLNSPNSKEKSKLPLFFKQLDSIKKENSTEIFYKYQKEDFIKDFDFITNNEFICEQSLESLVINQKNDEKDIYVVSFIAEYPLNELESEFKKINFDVTIMNENGKYKISKTCCF